ncbi:MAG: UDP-galactopyranose mutase [Phormidium sp.]
MSHFAWNSQFRLSHRRCDSLNSSYQAMPLHGYTVMFEKMLSHPNIKIMLNTDYREIQKIIPYREMIYTGPVDAFFDYRYGKLPYRSLEFKHETHNKPVHQTAPVVNYPNEHLYTRCTEFKYLTGQEHSKTSIVYEFPQAEGDPYYPVPRPENAELYKKYKELADAVSGVYFVGRLATYKYYNMDQCVAQALMIFKQISTKVREETVVFQPIDRRDNYIKKGSAKEIVEEHIEVTTVSANGNGNGKVH